MTAAMFRSWQSRQAHRCCLVLLTLIVVMPDTSLSTTPVLPIYIFDLPRAERRTLDQAACRPLKRRLQTSYGTDSDEDRREYSATVHCSSHRSIDSQLVVYKRSCRRMEGWNCDWAREVVLAAFDDRRVHVHGSGGLPLEESYAIVKHFVTRKLIDPPQIDELSDKEEGLPVDDCEVHYRGEPYQYELACRTDRRQVLRIQTREGVRYKQIPLPGCATKNNPACVAEE